MFRTQLAVRRAVAAERARLAREMHDSLGKTLHGIRLIAVAVQQGADRDPELTWSRAGALIEAVDLACTQARAILDGLRRDQPAVPLPEAVRRLVRSWSDTSGIPAAVHLDPVPLEPGGPVQHELLAVLDEALTNVARHSGAARVEVTLRYHCPCLELVVADDGHGLGTTPPPGARYGLVGIAERARSVGGWLVVAPNRPRGTRVVLRLPVPEMSPA